MGKAQFTTALNDRQRELLSLVAVEGNIARFTSQERITDWALLKKVLLTLGGEWKGGKTQGFLFPANVNGFDRVEHAKATGEILDPRLAGFFPTPSELGQVLIDMAHLRPGNRVLEPSAGQGALADLIVLNCPSVDLQLCELLDDNVVVLEKKGYIVTARDFLKTATMPFFDAVIMNPPFARAADIEHVTHAVEFLKQGGIVCAIMSAGVRFREDKKATAFRALVERMGGSISDNPEGSFLVSGTGVRTITVALPKK